MWLLVACVSSHDCVGWQCMIVVILTSGMDVEIQKGQKLHQA